MLELQTCSAPMLWMWTHANDFPLYNFEVLRCLRNIPQNAPQSEDKKEFSKREWRSIPLMNWVDLRSFLLWKLILNSRVEGVDHPVLSCRFQICSCLNSDQSFLVLAWTAWLRATLKFELSNNVYAVDRISGQKWAMQDGCGPIFFASFLLFAEMLTSQWHWVDCRVW